MASIVPRYVIIMTVFGINYENVLVKWQNISYEGTRAKFFLERIVDQLVVAWDNAQ